jgi:hypothetical protein
MRVGGAVVAEARQKPGQTGCETGDERHLPEWDWFLNILKSVKMHG